MPISGTSQASSLCCASGKTTNRAVKRAKKKEDVLHAAGEVQLRLTHSLVVRNSLHRNAQKIPTMQDMFMRHLAERAPKRGMARDLLGSLTYREMTEDLERFIALQLESSTWKGFSRAWAGLEEFCARVQLPTCE